MTEETYLTSCQRCGQLNIEIVDDSAPDFCDTCCICGNCTADGFDHDECFEEGTVEWVNIAP